MEGPRTRNGAPRRSRDWRGDLPFRTVLLHRAVGLYRNLADTIFPPRSSPEGDAVVRQRVVEAVRKSSGLSAPRHLENPDSFLVESAPLRFVERVLDPFPLPPRDGGGASEQGAGDGGATRRPSVMVLKRGQVLALVGGEDHLTLFCRTDGPFSAQFKTLSSLADSIGKVSPFARSDEYGWLASDPDHAGAGMVLSCDVCLMGLCVSRTLDQSLRALDRLGFDVYPIYGPFPAEDNPLDAPGCLYRVASVRNAGSARDIVGRMDAVCRELARQEQNARLTLLRRHSPDLFDFVRRAIASGAWCSSLQLSEALEIAQVVFFAADLGLVRISAKDASDLARTPFALTDEAVSRDLPAGYEARHARAALAAPLFRRILKQFQA